MNTVKLPGYIETYMGILEREEENNCDKCKDYIGKCPYCHSTKKNEKFYYLATPYSKYENLQEAYNQAANMLAFLTDNNIFAFSPITHYHTCASLTKEPPRSEEWNDICCKYLKLSRGLLVCMMDGWEESKGISKEIKLAIELNLPVIYTNYMELPLF